MNAQQCRVFKDLGEYDRYDNIAFSDLIKTCRLTSRKQGSYAPNCYRDYTAHDFTKAAHKRQYYALKQKESKFGAKFVDRDT